LTLPEDQGDYVATTSNIANSAATSHQCDHLNGGQLLDAFTHAANVVADHRGQLNALNVFPVPDGDTGTNMSLTMRSAIDAANQIPRDPPPTVGTVAAKIAYGALMGARGNSGVILSQILRGFAGEIEHLEEIEGTAIARALTTATTVAYKAVIKPVEGTMLTVIADAARAATSGLAVSTSAAHILKIAADAAEESLARTPDSLEVLRQAQVVDAGGQGVVYVLRALANWTSGDFTAIQIGEDNPVPTLANITIVDDDIHSSGISGYCTNFIVAGENIDLGRFRERLGAIGDSAVIVGDRALFKVHVHTDRPDRALALALEFGSLDRVAIENMERQADEVVANLAGQYQAGQDEPPGRQAVVTVADGAGLANTLKAMGATVVIQLDHGGKPSTEEMLRGVESVPADEVILLPNESDAIAAAKLVPALTGKHVSIVPSTSIVQGLAALSAMSSRSDLASNTATMIRAMNDATWAEITRAVKDTTVDDIPVRQGDLLCFVNGALKAAGTSLATIVPDVLSEVAAEEPEICTIFTGIGAKQSETAVVEQLIADGFPEAAIETIDGGQSFYHYIIAFE
jgi:DAK2 domain fusion protein YloV